MKYIIEYTKQVYHPQDNCGREFDNYWPEVFFTMIVDTYNAGGAMKIAKKNLEAVRQYGQFSDDDSDMPLEDLIDYTATKLETYIKNLEKNFNKVFQDQKEINQENFIEEQCDKTYRE